RRRQLDDRVAEREVLEARNAELIGEGDGERLLLIAMARLRAVDDEHADFARRMAIEERAGEGPGVREIVVRDDGAGEGSSHCETLVQKSDSDACIARD